MKYFLSLMLLLPLAGFGCGQKLVEKYVEKAIENEQGGNVNVDLNNNGNGLSYEDEAGNKVSYGGNISLPTDFPEDLPVYAQANILSTVMTDTGASLMLQSTDSADDIWAWYEARLPELGWKRTAQATYGTLRSATYTKDNQELGFSLTADPEQVVITLSAQNKAS